MYEMYSGSRSIGKLLLEIMGSEIRNCKALSWDCSLLRYVQNSGGPCVQSVFECGVGKSERVGKILSASCICDFPGSSWTEEMGKVNFPMVRIQPMDCQLWHSRITRLNFIQSCSNLSSLKKNLPSRRWF